MAHNVNEQAFLSQALPDEFRILGYRLLPFSVGHHMLLSWLGNKFLVGEGEPIALDLFQAIFVCSRPFSEGVRTVRTRAFYRWLRGLRFRLWVRRVLVQLDILPIESVSTPSLIGAFAEYLGAHSQAPESLPKSDGDTQKRAPGTPFVQWIAVTLMSKLNHGPADAMNKTWGHALHDVFSYWELEGQLRLVSDEDREVWEEHQQLLVDLADQIEALEKSLGIDRKKGGASDGNAL